jgi:hypothetical protein
MRHAGFRCLHTIRMSAWIHVSIGNAVQTPACLHAPRQHCMWSNQAHAPGGDQAPAHDLRQSEQPKNCVGTRIGIPGHGHMLAELQRCHGVNATVDSGWHDSVCKSTSHVCVWNTLCDTVYGTVQKHSATGGQASVVPCGVPASRQHCQLTVSALRRCRLLSSNCLRAFG